MNTRNTLTETEAKTYNLRKELAKQFRNARKGVLDTLVAYENTRDLVAMFSDDMIETADRLQHAVMSQITIRHSKQNCIKRGLDVGHVTIKKVRTREYLGVVQLPKNYIG